MIQENRRYKYSARETIVVIAILVTIVSMLLPNSCANTSGAPTGGPKDTIPPVLQMTIPENNSINFTGKRIELQFDEYVHVKDANKQIVVSPPMAKQPKIRTKGKGILLEFQEALDSNRTYCIYFGGAIADNNEGNPFLNYALSFSTGDAIDSLMFSGLVVDAFTTKPVDNATILLYTEMTDTTLAKSLPYATSKTDSWGYFCVRNLKDTLYHIYVINDVNGNFKLDDGEEIAFSSTPIRPVKVMHPDSPELKLYDAKDTVGLLSRPTDKTMYLYKEDGTRQFVKGKYRLMDREFAISFGAPNVNITSILVSGVEPARIQRIYNTKRDSVLFWIASRRVPDTLKCILNYYKTDDSLKTLVPAADTFKIEPVPLEDKNKDNKDGKETDKEHAGRIRIVQVVSSERIETQRELQKMRRAGASSTMEIKIECLSSSMDYDGFILKSDYLPKSIDASKITLSHLGTKEDTIPDKFYIERDLIDSCVFHVKMRKWEADTKYLLNVDNSAIMDIRGAVNVSSSVDIKTPSAEKTASITLALSNITHNTIVELKDNAMAKTFGTYYAAKDTTVVFPFLSAGTYKVVFTEDKNHNYTWDNGNYKSGREPERVRIYTLANGNDFIELKESMDIQQNINVEEVLNTDIPMKINKTK